MSVLICIPTDRDIDSRTAENAFAICANYAGGASFRTVRAHPTDRCRNLCVESLLRSQHSHIFFIDSDVVPPVGCLEAMLAVNRPIVCGIYPLQLEGELCTSVARKIAPNEYGFYSEYPSKPFEADAAGMGCCLIKREVFYRISSPWFQFVPREDGHQTGEDIYFFEKCALEGIRPLVIPQILCSHHKTVDLLASFVEMQRLRRELKVTQGTSNNPPEISTQSVRAIQPPQITTSFS